MNHAYELSEKPKLSIKVYALDMKDIHKQVTVSGDSFYSTPSHISVSGTKGSFWKDMTDATYAVMVEPL